jgi:phosphatidylinositol alpha-mannosyltransferase
MGRVEDGPKIEILSSSAILVAPNLGGESFGIVLVEAMASGAAVVASDLGSFRDVAGDSARYFETGNADALAGLLIDLLADEETRAGMAASGYDRAHEFDWEMVGSRYLSVYREAIS